MPKERREIKVRTKIDTMRNAAVDLAEVPQSKERARKFYRKGEAGDSKTHFRNPAIIKELDAWIESNLKGTGITFFKRD